MLLKKQIFQSNILKKLLTEEHSCVTLVPTTRILSLPPRFMNETKKGIFFMLNKALKKYDQHLDGILIGYQNVKILLDERTGLIPMGVADTRVSVSIEFYVFQPKIGGLLQGVVNKKSSSHIGCLVHKFFNASILKPVDIEYEDWDCKDINVDDQIKFKVTDLDFTGFVPRIEGTISEDYLQGSLSIGQNNNLIVNNLPNTADYEKGLLGSDEFWYKKLNKSNWVPEMNTQDSQQKSREKTSSCSESVEDDTGHESNHSPLHRKKKKRKDKDSLQTNFYKLSEGEDVDNNRGENNSLHLMTDETDDREKVSDEFANEETHNVDRDIKQGKKKTSTPKNSSKNSTSTIKTPIKNRLTEEEGMSVTPQTPATNFPDFSTSNAVPERRKKRKRDTLDEETTPITSRNVSKVDGRIQEKQSESDSGVGLEPKDSVRSPVLYRPPRKKKKETTSGDSEEESGSSETVNKDLAGEEMTELQLSLLRDLISKMKGWGTSAKKSLSRFVKSNTGNQMKDQETSPTAAKQRCTRGSEKETSENPNTQQKDRTKSSTAERNSDHFQQNADEKARNNRNSINNLDDRGNDPAKGKNLTSEKKTPKKPNAINQLNDREINPISAQKILNSSQESEKKTPKESTARLKQRETNPTARKTSAGSDKKAPDKSNASNSTEGNDLMQSIRMQMLKRINEGESEEEENLFKTPTKIKVKKKKKKKEEEKEETEDEMEKAETEVRRIEPDRLGYQASDSHHEDLLERLKRETLKTIEGDRDAKTSKPKKEKKTKEKKAKKEEKTKEKRAKKEEKISIIDEGDFGTLYTKLLSYAMSNVSGGKADEEDSATEKETKKDKKSKRKRENSSEEEDEKRAKKQRKNEKKTKKKKKHKKKCDPDEFLASFCSFPGEELRKNKKKKKDKKRKREKLDKEKRNK